MNLKWKSLLVVAGLMVATALVGAQAAQSQSPVKKVRKQITLSLDVKVGSTVLTSGKYEVSSNDQGLTFRRMIQDAGYPDQWSYDMKTPPALVKVTATMLEAKSKGTLMDMPADSSGARVLKSIVLEDTDVKFTIVE